MVGKREAQRQALKDRLFEAARARIEQQGLGSLRARDVTTDAGCALGGLYSAYEDMDDLVLQVNAATLRNLGACLEEAATSDAEPAERLVGLALSYLDFARNHINLWSAVFDHRMQNGREVPTWYNEEQKVLFAHIGKSLLALQPGMATEDLSIRVRTLFAAVHGIVSIGLREKIIGLPQEVIASEVEAIIRLLVRGAQD
ncbi:TetR/AcrR family transcriptional regulator [Hoeflea sp.]|uniref:TetR/AcrR family transcriptional regulator n=1 Tax=Hoeflea sp. TaxID=1940281 RepID=UPI0037492F74